MVKVHPSLHRPRLPPCLNRADKLRKREQRPLPVVARAGRGSILAYALAVLLDLLVETSLPQALLHVPARGKPGVRKQQPHVVLAHPATFPETLSQWSSQATMTQNAGNAGG